ncbi:Excinuclease ABC subunit C [hydrothermal vent metagenome]|uniref:Excinuclease ABC subunit C n=1 Tax=hydrothermal vent metagenome TaxID=652676 RepID=A0A1W1BWG0_9ZZZZ
MSKELLEQKIKNLPKQPGVYQYFDQKGRLLYVGKAKNLSNRVKSYWNFAPLRPSSNLSLRIKKMISEATDLEYIVVKSEHDALLLENSLIKQLNPKYNILLRDDKTYPYIYIDLSPSYPRFDITRKIIDSKDIKYFGPYSVGARDILDSIYELCKLVQKKSCLKGGKACLFYQIKRCLAPCEFDISRELYDKEIEKAQNFIKDKRALIKKLKERMAFYAEELRFEEAGELRDRIERIERSSIQSDIDLASSENYDIFVVEHDEVRSVVVRLFMREGKIISSSYDSVMIKENFDKYELLSRSILNFYAYTRPPVVAPILLNLQLEDAELIEEYLTKEFGKKVHIALPKRGVKRQLVDLALLNAKEILRQSKEKRKDQIQEEIKELFMLEHTPQRIECFDNSHLAGKATVGAMVVWEENAFKKSEYRHYHLEAKDEYAQMREMLLRRVESFDKNPPPDLWVIDGGATLLNLATDIIQSSGANVDIIAIAKEKIDAKAHRAKGKAKDIIHTKEGELRLASNDKRLHFIQRLRDEAHRFAITFHKKTKLKLDKESNLLNIKGISEAKVKRLLDYFGTFEAIKVASFEEISTILNSQDAKIIKKLYK